MTKPPKHSEPRTERHEHHIHQEKGKWEWALEVGIALMVLGTLAATSVAAYWTGEQWKVANTQLGVMQDTERRQLRAYVGVIPGDVEKFVAGQKLAVKITRKNYGMTPAYNVGFNNVLVKVLKYPFTIVGINEGCGVPNIPNLATMFPTAELPLTGTSDQFPTADEINEVKAGTFAFVFYGNICYHDAFNAAHYTNYCWFYRGDDLTAKKADGCLQHNDSN